MGENLTDIEELNNQLSEIHFILSGSRKIPPLNLPNGRKVIYSGKGHDCGPVYGESIDPDKYYSL
jgi:hypothetical protein